MAPTWAAPGLLAHPLACNGVKASENKLVERTS